MKRFPTPRHLKSKESGAFMTGYDDSKLESFLLNELSSSEREEIEQRIFSDDEMFVRVEEMENDLVDACAADAMPPALRERFERSLGTNPARRERLVVAKLLREKLPAATSGEGSNVVPFSSRRSTVFRGALAAAILVVLVGTPMLLDRDDRNRAETPAQVAAGTETESQAARELPDIQPAATESAVAGDAPLVAVKRPPVPMTGTPEPAHARRSAVFVLSTVTLRSGAGLGTLELGDAIDSVNLQLALETDEYPSYAVDIRNSQGASVWTGNRLHATRIDGGPAVSFDVPASVLEAGRHEIVLAGVASDGTEEIAYLEFDVRR